MILNQRFTKKLMYLKIQFSNKDKKLFDNIDTMYIYAILAIDSVGIRGYKDDSLNYERIIVLHVKLNNDKNIEDISEKLHSIFPNPMIIELKYKDKLYISVAHKRINMADKTKTVVTESNLTIIENESSMNKIIELLNYKVISNSNLYEFYLDFYNRLYLSELDDICELNEYKYTKDTSMLIKRYKDIEKTIQDKKHQMSKLVMMRDQMKINIEIKSLEEHLREIEDKIKEEQNG